MKVDGLDSSYSKFSFSKPNHGFFSLVSNSLLPFQGGYQHLRLSSQGKTLLEIDFTKLTSVDELEQYFDCYYFETLLTGEPTKKVPISNHWCLNDLGYLICHRNTFNMYHQLDAANMCMLTYRHQALGDFDLTLDFVQSWGRYGVAFGCEKGYFPYYYQAQEHNYKPTSGVFAYVEAEGYRTMRGDLLQSAFNNTQKHLIRYADEMLPTFYTTTEGELCSPRVARLIYYIDADGSYVCSNKTLPIKPGYLTFLPPFTKYKPSLSIDKHIAIEFYVLHGDGSLPDFVIPKRPEKIRLLFEQLLLLQSDTSYNAKYKRYSIFYQILAEAQNGMSEDDTIPNIIRPSVDYMNKNFANPKLTISEIAQISNISEVYFRLLFKEATGILPNKYILKLRINHACFLLQGSKYKVSEVALKSGFSDVKYFMTTFKKATGFTPQKYRQLHN